MKKAFAVMTIAIAMSGAVLAQTPSTPTSTLKPAVSTTTQTFRASTLLGVNVKNDAGETIGEVTDLVRQRDNELLQAVISVGGFLGIGNKLVAIPYDNLKVERINNNVQVMYNATQAELEGLPTFLDTEAARAQLALSAHDLIGADVKNASDDTIGEIDDLMLTSVEPLSQVIVSVGGFLGMGEKLVAIPYNAVTIRRVNDKQHVLYNATTDELKALPAFKYN